MVHLNSFFGLHQKVKVHSGYDTHNQSINSYSLDLLCNQARFKQRD